MARSVKPYSIGFLPEKIRVIDAAARSGGSSRSQYVNHAVDQLLRGQFMSNSKMGTVLDTEAVPYGLPSNQHMPRGRPGSVSTPAGKVAAKTHPRSASPAAKAKADFATDPSKGVMPGQPEFRQTFR